MLGLLGKSHMMLIVGSLGLNIIFCINLNNLYITDQITYSWAITLNMHDYHGFLLCSVLILSCFLRFVIICESDITCITTIHCDRASIKLKSTDNWLGIKFILALWHKNSTLTKTLIIHIYSFFVYDHLHELSYTSPNVYFSLSFWIIWSWKAES